MGVIISYILHLEDYFLQTAYIQLKYLFALDRNSFVYMKLKSRSKLLLQINANDT